MRRLAEYVIAALSLAFFVLVAKGIWAEMRPWVAVLWTTRLKNFKRIAEKIIPFPKRY